MEIKADKISKSVYLVTTSTGKRLGTFELNHDGFYKYWRDVNNEGFWEAHTLRAIANKLDEVNKPYREEVEKYFANSDCKDEGEMSYGCKRSGDSLCENCAKLKIDDLSVKL